MQQLIQYELLLFLLPLLLELINIKEDMKNILLKILQQQHQLV